MTPRAELQVGKLAGGGRFSVPVDVVTQKLAFLGRTGSGKSYAASKLAEGMHDAGAQLVVLDPVGIWYGVRLGKDGKSPGLPIPVFGGLHGDIPLEPTAGALIADLVVDRGISVVLDVSQFEHDSEKARFAAAFADRFFFRKKAAPSAVHVFLEECQEFVPQNPQKGEERMLHAFTRLEKLGRNFGIGVSLITQRPQEVNKKALNMTECLFAFQMRGPQERKTVEDWADVHGVDLDIKALLPQLAVGNAHASSPQWLRIAEVVRFDEKRTFDTSATPQVGKRSVVRELAPIDLEKIQTEMAATLERAKAEDPKELQRRIRELEAELKKKPAAAAADPAAIERAVDEATRLQREYNLNLHAQLGRAEALANHLVTVFKNGGTSERGHNGQSGYNPGHKEPVVPTPPPAAAHGPRTPAAPPAPARPERAEAPAAGLTGPQQKILDTLASSLDRENLQTLCGPCNSRKGARL